MEENKKEFTEEFTEEFTDEFQKIDGTSCRICSIGSEGPIIVWGMYPHGADEFEHLMECIAALLPGKSFTLASFTVTDWDRDFSPWEVSGDAKDTSFGGEGEKTLHWLTESYVPWLKREFGEQRSIFLIGYSLAGLFALWSAYESNLFSGIACCSGSLWFPGWDEYCQTHTITNPCKVYLSLGGKEEKTASTQMASVGIRTREQEKILKKTPAVSNCILEWNSGGHFADSGKRLAKGVRWLLSH